MAVVIQRFPLFLFTGSGSVSLIASVNDAGEQNASQISAKTGLAVQNASSFGFYLGFDAESLTANPHITLSTSGGTSGYGITVGDAVLTHHRILTAAKPTLYSAILGNFTLLGIHTDACAQTLDVIADRKNKLIFYISDDGTLCCISEDGAVSVIAPQAFIGTESQMSLAPCAMPDRILYSSKLHNILLIPYCMRASKEYQQFVIEDAVYLASGNPLSATGAQFVVGWMPDEEENA